MMKATRSNSWGRTYALPGVTTVAVLALWEVFANAGISPEGLSSPSRLGTWLLSAGGTREFWVALAQTTWHWGAGLLIAIIAGVVAGLAIGLSRTMLRLTQLPFEFLRAIPPIVYLPLLLLVSGATPEVAIGLAALGAVWPILFQTVYGLRQVEPLALDTGRVYGLTRRQRITSIVLPSVAPSIATGIRISAAVALVVSITMELVAGIPGLGASLRTYQANGVIAAVFGLVFVTGVMGLILNLGLERVERRVLQWHVPYRPIR